MSQSIDDRLSGLLKLYISGSCNYEEYQELLALLKVQTDDSHIEALLQEEIANSRYHEAEQQVNWQQMLQAVLQQKDMTEPAPVRRFPVYKMAAAAALIIALGTITWWWLQQSNNGRTNDQPVAGTTDIMPGKNGAILTLGNGQQLVLDSTGNGALYSQPGLQIVKRDSLIAYAAPVDKAGSGPVSYNTLTTPKGRQFQVVLSDGTKVWLNASSSIHYPAVFAAQERVVEVTGEVYFEVAKDPRKPFKVNFTSKAGGGRQGTVEVLGTHFNINVYNDEEAIRTTLLEGKVKASMANGGSLLLKPGEQAVCTGDSPLTIDHSPNLGQVMAWKNGYFQFDRVDIKTVMRQIGRWYDVEIIYEGPVTNDRFGGSIPRDATLSQVLNALEQSLVHFTIQGKKVIVKP
jgi:ferric-dicitrate binding protein FerR (iron transport regulator)